MKKFVFILTLLYILISSSFIFAAAKTKSPAPVTAQKIVTGVPVSIIGLVEAIDYDENDNPLELRLISEIEINKNEAGTSLSKYIDKYVKVTGTVSIAKDNTQVITISKVEPIDENEPLKAEDLKE